MLKLWINFQQVQWNIFHELFENVFHNILGFDFTRKNDFHNTPIKSIIWLTSWFSGSTTNLRKQILLSVLSPKNLSLIVWNPWFFWDLHLTCKPGKDSIHMSLFSTSPSSECNLPGFLHLLGSKKSWHINSKILLTSSESFSTPLVNWVDPFPTFLKQFVKWNYMSDTSSPTTSLSGLSSEASPYRPPTNECYIFAYESNSLTRHGSTLLEWKTL